MTAELKIRGVPYRSMDEVEGAVKELAAAMTVLPTDSDERDDYARHIGELLASLPDERAMDLLAYINAPFAADPGDHSAEAHGVETLPEGVDVALPTSPDVPVCPMCLGHGVLDVEPPQDPTTTRCVACNGYGKVYTGSRVDGHTMRDCPACQGNGYTNKQPDVPLPPPPRRAAAAPAWPDAVWNPATQLWDAPGNGLPPWEGASWDGYEGRYN